MKKCFGKLAVLLAVAVAVFVGTGAVALADTSEDGYYEYSISDSKATITKYLGPGGDVTVPDTLGGCPVEAIGDKAFYQQDQITAITLPDSITSIGDCAFMNCYTVKSIDLGHSVVTIGDAVFDQCYLLESLQFPATVTSLSALDFYNCSSLSSLIVDDGNAKFSSVDSILYNKDKTSLLFCPVTRTGLVTIPNGVATIGGFAFENCKHITGINMPNSIYAIGDYAFSGCTGLNTIIYSNILHDIGISSFSNTGLTSIILPSSVRKIDQCSFSGNINATAITLPDQITAIPQGAFEGCRSIRHFTIPANVTSIGDSAFELCSDLESISIPNKVRSIGKAAFSSCYDLLSISIPSSVTSIGNAVFMECPSLETIEVDKDNAFFKSDYGVLYDKLMSQIIACPAATAGTFSIPSTVTSIHSYAFFECKELTKIIMPACVTDIQDYAFSDCYKLSDVNIPQGITTLNRHIFMDCWNISDIEIPDSVTSIGYGTFGSCHLSNVILPSKLVSIGDYAFMGNQFHSGQVIPASVTSIGEHAFDSNFNMTDINFVGTKPQMGSHMFDDAASGFKVYYSVNYSDSWSGYRDYPSQAYCKATIDPQNGSNAVQEILNVTSGHIATPPTPERAGFVFGGWYKEKECIQGWDFSKEAITGDISLFAKWGYHVTFSVGNGAPDTTLLADVGGTVGEPSTPSRQGYTFGGWYQDTLYTENSRWNFNTSTVNSSITLYAKWTANTYTVSFDAKGGRGVTTPISVTFGKPYGPLPTLTNPGHFWGGWNTQADGKGMGVSQSSTVAIASNHTLFAVWISYQYTVKINPQNGSAITSMILDYDSLVPKPDDPTREGYNFCGWCLDDLGLVPWDFDTDTVDYNFTLYAKWSNGPATITATPQTYNSINIDWTAITGASKYELWRSTSATEGFVRIATTVSTSYTNKSVITGLHYYYEVRSYQLINGRKVYTDFSPVASAQTTLGTPTLQEPTVSYNSVKLTWTGVAGRTRYEIWRAVEDGAFARIATTTSTSYTNRNLATGTTYHYKVVAYRFSGKAYGGYSEVKTAQPLLGSVEKCTAKRASSTSIKVSWSAVAGRTKYEIWVSSVEGGTYTLLTTTTGTSYVDKGLITGVPRYYKVIAYRTVNGVKQYGGYSPVASMTP